MGRGRPRVPGAKRGRARVGGVVSLNRWYRRQMGRSGSAHRGLPYDVPGRRARAHRDVAADGWRPEVAEGRHLRARDWHSRASPVAGGRRPRATTRRTAPPSWGLFPWALLAVWFPCTVVLA